MRSTHSLAARATGRREERRRQVTAAVLSVCRGGVCRCHHKLPNLHGNNNTLRLQRGAYYMYNGLFLPTNGGAAATAVNLATSDLR